LIKVFEHDDPAFLRICYKKFSMHMRRLCCCRHGGAWPHLTAPQHHSATLSLHLTATTLLYWPTASGDVLQAVLLLGPDGHPFYWPCVRTTSLHFPIAVCCSQSQSIGRVRAGQQVSGGGIPKWLRAATTLARLSLVLL
jgi:hypothetical protein